MEKDVLKEENSSYFVSSIGIGRKVLTANLALHSGKSLEIRAYGNSDFEKGEKVVSSLKSFALALLNESSDDLQELARVLRDEYGIETVKINDCGCSFEMKRFLEPLYKLERVELPVLEPVFKSAKEQKKYYFVPKKIGKVRTKCNYVRRK